jgi:predicted alpha/beta-fold hydrolase
MLDAAVAAEAAGLSCLRLDLRGADLRGEDFFHGGLGSDLRAVLASAECALYDDVLLLGYSLGGHVCLTHLAQDPDPRVRALVAVCSPLDLHAAATAFDEGAHVTYRRHVLGGLKQMYGEVAKRRSNLPLAVEAAARIQTIRDWDDQIVAPRFGFESALHYYREASAAQRLARISVPTLLLSAARDPMVPRESLLPYHQALSPAISVVEKSRGGHVAFPRSFDLGEEAAPGLESQALAWLQREGSVPRTQQL